MNTFLKWEIYNSN